jgi:hypothetical protein
MTRYEMLWVRQTSTSSCTVVEHLPVLVKEARILMWLGGIHGVKPGRCPLLARVVQSLTAA